MNAATQTQSSAQMMQSLLSRQKAAYLQSPAPSAEHRIDQLKQLKAAILANKDNIVAALNQDYGQRSAEDSLLSDVLPCVMNINYTVKRLKKWMKPQRRHAGMLLSPAKVTVHYQPLGVIGIVVPWNFPVQLALTPLITTLAAGNRAMIKLSEFTPHTNQAIRAIISSVFDEDTVAIIEGEAEVAAKFTALAFDHLLFTGSTTVGRHVMRAAADNLTPVTLELGGKSPVIIANDMPMATAVERLIFGKCLNAGQICVAPDYILCPKDKINDFIEAYQHKFQQMYGREHSKDYSYVVNDAQYNRLLSWLDDAVAKGAKVVSANGKAVDRSSRQLPTQLITEVTDDMLLMQQEIFGPLLPILPYEDLEQAIDYINKGQRPLALYLMSFDKDTQQQVLARTHSGGVCINDTLLHVAADDAPFGGIGDSGMGHYHGHEGFLTFSKAKTVLSRGKLNTGALVQPPYGKLAQKLLLKTFLR